MAILAARNQAGAPRSANTDACLGWPLYAYQSWEVPTDSRNGARSILLRAEGWCGKGSEASRPALAQRAKVGICPCCAAITHALIPATYAAGAPGRRKKNAARLWQKRGPFGSRSYAAGKYSNEYGSIPPSWDWIARGHRLHLPPPLGRTCFREAANRPLPAAASPDVNRPFAEDVNRPIAEDVIPVATQPDTSMALAPVPTPECLSQSQETRDAPSSSRGGRRPKPPPPIYERRSSRIRNQGSPRWSGERQDAWGSDWRGKWQSTSARNKKRGY